MGLHARHRCLRGTYHRAKAGRALQGWRSWLHRRGTANVWRRWRDHHPLLPTPLPLAFRLLPTPLCPPSAPISPSPTCLTLIPCLFNLLLRLSVPSPFLSFPHPLVLLPFLHLPYLSITRLLRLPLSPPPPPVSSRLQPRRACLQRLALLAALRSKCLLRGFPSASEPHSPFTQEGHESATVAAYFSSLLLILLTPSLCRCFYQKTCRTPPPPHTLLEVGVTRLILRLRCCPTTRRMRWAARFMGSRRSGLRTRTRHHPLLQTAPRDKNRRTDALLHETLRNRAAEQ